MGSILYYTGINSQVLIKMFLDIGVYWSLALLCTMSIIILFLGLKWEAIMLCLNPKLEVRRGYYTFYSAMGLLTNICMPQVGTYGVKVGSLKALYSVPLSTGALCMVIDQIFELVVIVFFMVPGLLFITKIVSLTTAMTILIFLILFLGLLLMLRSHDLFHVIIRLYKKFSVFIISIPILKRFGKNFENNESEKINLKGSGRIFVYALMKHLATVLKTYILMSAVGLNISFIDILLVAAIVYFIGLTGITPAGLGIRDAGWLGILSLLGVDRTDIGLFIVAEWVIENSALLLVTIGCYIVYSGPNKTEFHALLKRIRYNGIIDT